MISRALKLALVLIVLSLIFVGTVFAELSYVEGALYESNFSTRAETDEWRFVRSQIVQSDDIPKSYFTDPTARALNVEGSYVVKYSMIWSSFHVVFDANDVVLLAIPTGL